MARVGLTHSIVAHGRLDVDEIAPLEIDKAKVGAHFYCDKAPGLSLLCVPSVAVANWAMDLAGLDATSGRDALCAGANAVRMRVG